MILFSDKNLDAEVEDGSVVDETAIKLKNLIESISKYINWSFMALFFSCSLLLQFFFKTVFNVFASKKIPYDKWTIMDTLCGSLNIIAVVALREVKPETLLETLNKEILDYFMIFVLCICYLRFFTYFLVMRNLAKLLLILVAMLKDTIAFLFILASFIVIMSSIFTTLYQNSYPDLFGNLVITARFLYDAAIGQYAYDGIEGDRAVSCSILLTFHTFMGNVFLLNYLIAILSTTYETLSQSGIFMYKVNVYQYCERYITAFND